MRLARAAVRLGRHPGAPKQLTLLEEAIRTNCPLLEQRVQITGTSRGDLNRRIGVASAFDQSSGRYVVELEGKGEKGNEKLKLKPENLSKAVEGKKKKGKRK